MSHDSHSAESGDFLVVYVDGPLNGLIEHSSMSLAKTAYIRHAAWYEMPYIPTQLRFEDGVQIREKAGVKPWGQPVYRFEETDDPKICKYVYAGEYPDLLAQGVLKS